MCDESACGGNNKVNKQSVFGPMTWVNMGDYNNMIVEYNIWWYEEEKEKMVYVSDEPNWTAHRIGIAQLG